MFEPHGFCCSPPTAVIICWEAASLAFPVPTAGPLCGAAARVEPCPAQWANPCWVTKNSEAMFEPHGFCCSPPTAVIICCEAASLAFPVPTAGPFDATGDFATLAGPRCGLAARVEP